MKLVQINPDTIPIGEALPFSLRCSDGELMVNQGTVLESRAALEFVRERRAVYVEETPELVRPVISRFSAFIFRQSMLSQYPSTAPESSQEMAMAQGPFGDPAKGPDWKALTANANAVLRDALQTPGGLDQLVRLHREVATNASLYPDATLVALFHYATTDSQQYSATHAMLVSAICMLAARNVLGWDEERQNTAGLAALTMNLTMTDLQDELAHQAERPTPEQRKIIERHAASAVAALQALGVDNREWLDAVQHHHDVPAGSLKGRDMGLQIARLIQRADVYAARVSPRAKRPGMAPPSAMQAAYFDEQRKVDEAGAAIIKAVGIYPPGTFVRLVNNEVAMVVRRGATTTTPKVAVLINKTGIPAGEASLRDTAQRDFRIAASLPRREVNVNFDIRRLLAFC